MESLRAATRIGAPADDPVRGVAELRALATRHGIELTQVSEIDAVSAVVAAELWCSGTGLAALSESALASPAALTALARILLRAAGSPGSSRTGPTMDSQALLAAGNALDDAQLRHVEFWAEWLEENSENPSEAARRIGADLMSGTHPGLVGMATAVLSTFSGTADGY